MFHPVDSIPALQMLENAWRDIRDEMEALTEAHFRRWPEQDLYSGSWDVFGLLEFGHPNEITRRLCPRTAACLDAVPRLVTAGFSAMAPGTHIRPHVGYTTDVLRAHLGLVSTPECALRVGDTVRSWEEGRCLLFDDTVEHEAWNRGSITRVVLLMDIAREGVKNVAYPEHVLRFAAAQKGQSGLSA